MSDTPQFDVSGLSWKDSKEATLLQMRQRKAFEDRDIEGVAACFDDMQKYLSRVVVDVPRDWLVPDAPAKLDWTKPESFDWLRGSKMQELNAALALAMSPEQATKN